MRINSTVPTRASSSRRRNLRSSLFAIGAATAAVGAMSNAASGQTFINWVGGTGNIVDPNKWSPAQAPNADTIAILTSNSSTVPAVGNINPGDNITTRELNIGNGDAPFGTVGSGAVIQSGGTISVTDWLTIGRFGNNAYSGSYTMTGGTLNKSGGGLLSVALGGDAGASTFTVSGDSIVNNNGPGDTRIGAGPNGGTMTMSGNAQFNHNGSQFKVGDGLFDVGHMTMNDASKVTATNEVFIGIYGGDGDLTMNGTSSITKTGVAQFAICDSFYRGEDPTSGTVTMNGNSSITVSQGDTPGGLDGEFWVGQGVNGTGLLTMNDNATLTVHNRLQVGRSGGQGTLNINGNAKVIHAGTWGTNTTYFEVGIFADNGNGIVNQNGGLLDMQTGGTRIGDNTSTGTYNLKGGTAHFGTELTVAMFGQALGTLNVTGGAGDADVINIGGEQSQTVGTVTVSGGTLVSRNDIRMAVGQGGAGGTLTVTGGTVRQNNAAGFISVGEQGAGTLTINNGGQVLAAGYVVLGLHNSTESTATTTYVTGSGTLNLGANGLLGATSLRGGAGTKTVTFNGGTLQAAADDTDFIRNLLPFQVEVESGGLTIDSNGHNVGLNLALDGAGGLTKKGAGTLTLTVNQDYLGTTTVQAGTLKTNLATGTAKIKSLSLGGTPAAPTGKLDTSRKPLVIDYTGTSPLSTIRQYLQAGLTSNDTVGITFAGRGVNEGIGYTERTYFTGAAPAIYGTVDNTSILLRATLRGDANLDGTVNFDDLLALAKSYNGTNTVWTSGDFDYNGATNFDDLLALAKNYNGNFTAAQSAEVGSAFASDFALAQSIVPEPSTLGLLAGLGGMALTRRRN